MKLATEMTKKAKTFVIAPSVPHYRVLFFFVVCALPLIAFARLSEILMHLVLNDQTFSHAPLIPLISVVLVYLNRSSILREVSLNWILGTPFLSVGFGLMAAARVDLWQLTLHNQLSLFALGLVLVWVGAFAFCFGEQPFHAAHFPLAFLSFAIPIPEPILSRTILFLQVGSADCAEMFFRLMSVPYLREDLVFRLPGVAIRVAEECSGIRSSLALLITTVLACHLFLERNTHRILTTSLVVPLAILKNGLRIATLSVLAIYVDPGFLYGNLHHRGGIVFFAIALVPMGLIFMLLRRREIRGAVISGNIMNNQSRAEAINIGDTRA